ncbi:uncharacterized protein LOC111866572 [Cryptotermes secundus]|nr:uncharacterized protein LOC111866572 [Cryptotermes secundus]
MMDRSLYDFPLGKRVSTEERCSALELPVVKRWTCEQTSYSGEKIRAERVVLELCVCNDKVSSFKSYAVKYEVPASVLNMYSENINTPRLKDVPDRCLRQKGKVETLPELKTNMKPLSSTARNLTHNIYRWRKNKTESKTKNSAEQGIYIFLALIFVVAAVVVCSSLYFASQQRVCEMTLDMGVLRTALENNIFGQKAAVHDIMSVLNKFYNTHYPGIVILAFAGGTGVG